MKPHPRIRKTIKWGKYGGAAVTLLLVVVWIGSGLYHIAWQGKSGASLGIAEGICRVGYLPDWYSMGLDPGWEWYRETFHPFRFQWGFDWISGSGWTLDVPLWLPTLVAFSTASVAWCLDALARRRARGGVNLCPKCNYDRAGIAADAKCPECGANRR
ncbi:MAG TPA: hypothetical protein VHC70_11205 [Phycisphaerales bacterium]|nr:hypothetical protein [Phycisphaerales bacterium]